MRKGADCLSKWVGEAERQLRLLFEEAKKCQPSIIFFDEIDGKVDSSRTKLLAHLGAPSLQALRQSGAASKSRFMPRSSRRYLP